jgi:hypothetical protein
MTAGLLIDALFGKAHEMRYKPLSGLGNGLVLPGFKKRLLCTFASV